MTEAAATPPKAAKAAKAAATKAFDMPFEAFSMNMPQMEVPAAFREMAEKSVSSAKEAYAKMKSAAEETTDAFEDSYEATREGMLALGYKMLDAGKARTDSAFDLARGLLATKTFAEAIELQSRYLRQEFEALTAQAKDFQDLTTKVVTDASKPMKDSVEKSVKTFGFV
ncbi:phasin [Prosthecomicrobium pneumaticum]|uniref:Phasin n=1 Tax=Prosthecomicrobium pneumaticum TaxID=81895 RepID=A0A7W9CUK1_9HYPH|nr:phasin [Prosthecomicrobium pneumaticum]MBB5752180.1 phasin [Prosthecomicrobium pneumaticum]